LNQSNLTIKKEIPLIRIRDIGKNNSDTFYDGSYDSTYIVEAGDLLIGMDGDFNCDRWKGTNALLNQRVCKVIVASKYYEPTFLDFVLPGYLKAINEQTSFGTGYQRVTSAAGRIVHSSSGTNCRN
jgi:type I restriction enzyme S subunit